ncbi:MAG: SDR family NAD(P)-dependent oxidoreductase, partial [Gammaproteobacteria bacterium]
MASDPTAKWILITGASSGIGLCAARELRARGYRVIATARKLDDVDSLGAQGFNAVRLDLSDSASIRAAVAAVVEQTEGHLYALFNNAGFGQIGPLEDLSRAALRAQFEVNLFGIHEITALILPLMRAQGYGRIIQTSSLLGLIALRYRGAYNASKYALEAWSDTLRLELSGTGIHVVLIEPGPITSRF